MLLYRKLGAVGPPQECSNPLLPLRPLSFIKTNRLLQWIGISNEILIIMWWCEMPFHNRPGAGIDSHGISGGANQAEMFCCFEHIVHFEMLVTSIHFFREWDEKIDTTCFCCYSQQ